MVDAAIADFSKVLELDAMNANEDDQSSAANTQNSPPSPAAFSPVQAQTQQGIQPHSSQSTRQSQQLQLNVPQTSTAGHGNPSPLLRSNLFNNNITVANNANNINGVNALNNSLNNMYVGGGNGNRNGASNGNQAQPKPTVLGSESDSSDYGNKSSNYYSTYSSGNSNPNSRLAGGVNNYSYVDNTSSYSSIAAGNNYSYQTGVDADSKVIPASQFLAKITSIGNNSKSK
jgi:hypothetical protein